MANEPGKEAVVPKYVKIGRLPVLSIKTEDNGKLPELIE